MEPRSVAQNNTVKEGEHSIPEDRLRSTSVSSASSAKSASSDFSFDDQYQLDEINEHGSFALDNDRDSNNNAPVTQGSTSTLETPPIQVMERPPDTSSDYRIPSHVFASNKSGTPNPEWSTASNESLFSIHTGNMSFTRDQFSWLLKSGELGMYTPGDIRKSGELPPPSPKIVPKSGEQMPNLPPDTYKSGEQIIASHFKAASASTPPAVNRPDNVEVKSPVKANDAAVNPDLTDSVKKDDPIPEIKVKKGRSSPSDEVRPPTCVSPHSDASGQSFAFPVLAEIGRDKSVNSGQSRADQKNSSNPEQDGPKTPTSAAAAPPASSSWFSRISRCSCW